MYSMFDVLDESNFMLFAAKHYDNPHCYETVEFYDDLNRFKYIKRLFNRYLETGELRERLILNHIIVLYNVFGAEATTRMLFLKLEGYYAILKPFLVLLSCMPDVIHSVGSKDNHIISSDIPLDTCAVEALRNI